MVFNGHTSGSPSATTLLSEETLMKSAEIAQSKQEASQVQIPCCVGMDFI
jgi:hypothetical protein